MQGLGAEIPYEKYLEQVDKELPSMFLDTKTEFLRIPPSL